MTPVAAPATHPLRAAAWMIGTISAFTVMALAGRAVSPYLDTFEIMAFRSLIGIGLVLAVGSLAGTLGQVRTNRIGMHLVRNTCHFAGQNLWFYALAVIPMAQVIALEFTYPIWVALAAPLLLGERLTRTRLLAALIGFVGILVVVRPGYAEISVGTVTALLSAFGFAGSAMVTKILTRDQTITCILFWLTVMQAAMGLVMAGIDGDINLPRGEALPLVAVIAVAGLTAHFCLTKALSLAPATIVTPLDFARLPMVAMAAALVYGETLDPYVLIGGAIILCAIYMNLSSESRRRRRAVAS